MGNLGCVSLPKKNGNPVMYNTNSQSLIQEKKETNNNQNLLIENAKKSGIVNEDNQYIHKVTETTIDCPNMTKSKTSNPSYCKVYHAMKVKYQFNEENLKHLHEYRHFKNGYKDKPVCKYKDECKSYIRSETGVDENRIDDKCHMELFRHPPRTRQIKLAANLNSLNTNKSLYECRDLYGATHEDKNKYRWNKIDGWLQALIDEVINNGYKYDLCLQCGANDECMHDVYDEDNKYILLKVVDEKMNCNRHRLMGSPLTRDRMLALILYTSCDCNYNLCSSQRNKNYWKWKWFDRCLYKAIQTLSDREIGEFPVFSGLNGVKLNKQTVKAGYFVTYISTSWRKEVSLSFMGGKGDKGMIIEFDKDYKGAGYIYCCDVSWISKFPDECEILFARSTGLEEFKCVLLDESDGIQTVSLEQADRSVYDSLFSD